MVPPRLRRLPSTSDGVVTVHVAAGLRARLLGLALLDRIPADCALLLPRCCSVHTFGMRFALDIAFLDGRGRVLRVERAVPARRLLFVRGARQVLEWPAPTQSRSSPGA